MRRLLLRRLNEGLSKAIRLFFGSEEVLSKMRTSFPLMLMETSERTSGSAIDLGSPT